MVENNYMPMGCVIMDIWAAVIFAAALSIDAFGIGFSCSLRGIRIPLRCKLIICGVSVIVTAAATVTGYLASGFLPEHAGNVIGSVMLILLGIYIFAGALLKHRKKSAETETVKAADILLSPEVCDMDSSSDVDMREALYTGMALSADSFSAGIGAGVAGGAELIPVFCGLFQLLLLCFGGFCGGMMKSRISGGELWLTLLSSLMLIAFGIIRLLF